MRIVLKGLDAAVPRLLLLVMGDGEDHAYLNFGVDRLGLADIQEA